MIFFYKRLTIKKRLLWCLERVSAVLLMTTYNKNCSTNSVQTILLKDGFGHAGIRTIHPGTFHPKEILPLYAPPHGSLTPGTFHPTDVSPHGHFTSLFEKQIEGIKRNFPGFSTDLDGSTKRTFGCLNANFQTNL